VPLWFDVLFFSGFAATGCWLGLVSLEAVLARFKTRSTRFFAATIVCVLCGYGVYLGRFRRLNSWDILDDPLALMRLVLQPIFDPLAHPRALGFTFAFAVFFGAQLLLLAVAAQPRVSCPADDLSHPGAGPRSG